MVFEQIVVGGDRNFAYLIGDKTTEKAAVIDPAFSPSLVLQRAESNGLTVAYLINTHSRYDHANGNAHVLDQTNAEALVGGINGVRDGHEISLGEVKLRLIHTPGHTMDSICILAMQSGVTGKLVTGDTLFVGKVGGTDFGSAARLEYDSLHNKLMVLPDETEVWPGHNYGVAPSSTIGHEKETNPFILREDFDSFVDLKRNWLEYKTKHGIK